MYRLLTLATFLVAAIFTSALIPRSAHADCQQSGNDVLCSGGIDQDGFVLRTPNLNFRTVEGSLVVNVDTGLLNGSCPLALPAVALGANATVLNQGTITASGVCGWALEVSDRSTVTNPGSLLSVGILGFGVVGDDHVTVTNTGQIRTVGTNASGVSLGNDAVVTNTGGVIATAGLSAPAIDVLARGVITNTGTVSTQGDFSDGIRTANDSTVVNKTTILVSGQRTAGVRMLGGTLSLNNSGTISALTATPALPPDAGVIMQGETVNATNSGNIIASSTGVSLSATDGITFNNSGTITAGSGPASSAVLINVAGGKTATVSNAGGINGNNGSASIRVISGNVQLTNSGYLRGDVLFGSGNDTLDMLGGGTFVDVLDGGDGDDTLILGDYGAFLGTVRNVETLRVFTTKAWTIGTAVFTKSATVVLGTLSVNGALLTPQLDIGQAAALRGYGPIVGAVTNHGTIYPGAGQLDAINRGTILVGTAASPGTLSIVGSYTQFATGTLYLRLNYTAVNDQLAVTGPATLNGGTLHLQIAENINLRGAADGNYTLLTATGGISGSFKNVETNSFFLKASLTQTATSLSAQVTHVPYASVALTRAQRQAASLFDRAQTAGQSTGLLDSVSSAEEARRILNQFAPEIYPAVQNTGLFSLTAVRDSLRGKTALAGESWHAWGAYILRGGDEPTSAQSYDIQGGIAGMGKMLPDGTAIGVSVAHTTASDTFINNPDRADFDATFAGLTAAHSWGDITLESGFLYGGGDIRVQRAFTLNGSSQTLSSTPSATLLSVYSDATMNRAMGQLNVTPRAGIAYDRMELGGVDERVSGSLKTADSSVQTLRSEIGLRATVMTARIRPYGGVTASWDLLGEPRAIPVVFNVTNFGATTGFTLKGEHPKRFNLDVEGGINFAINGNFTGSVGGRIAANDRFAGHSIVARLLWLW